MRSALITGIAGQDGSYLAELLLAQNWQIHGAVSDVSESAGNLNPEVLLKARIIQWEPLDTAAMVEVLRAIRPDIVFNLAARSSGSRMFEDPVSVCEINGVSVVRLLEAIRIADPAIRLCQASSSEMFGEVAESPQSELTSFRPGSPYAAAKLLAHCAVGAHRARHNLFAASAILFNHESPRRGEGFVTRKIARGVARIHQGLQKELALGNLDARRDWGYAPDYVRAMLMMATAERADDFVIATGIAHSVREFCDHAFSLVGLDYRDFVREDPELMRPIETATLIGNPAKARETLGWRPEVQFLDLVRLMVESEVRSVAGHSRDSGAR